MATNEQPPAVYGGDSSGDNARSDAIIKNWSDEMLTKLIDNAIPVPIRVACTVAPIGKPDYLGEEYHGRVSKEDDRKLLEGKSGRFIIRDTHGVIRDHEFTLVFNYGGDIQTVKLVYNPTNKRFKTEETSTKEFKSVLDLMTDVLGLFQRLRNCQLGTEKFTKTLENKKNSYQKSHKFNLHTYLIPKWCTHCHEFLWGLHKQGYLCEDCGITVHRICKDLVTLPCGITYGTKLTNGDTFKVEKVLNDSPKKRVASLPVFHNKCLYFRTCSRFLSAFNLRDIYVDMVHKSTKCFCPPCTEDKNIGNEDIGNEDEKTYNKSFLKWTVHQFVKQQDPLKRNTSNWEIAFLAIKPHYIEKVITGCFQPTEDEDNFDITVATSFTQTIEDLKDENWSYRFTDSQTGDFAYAQSVLEILIKPDSYEVINLPHNDPQFPTDCCDVKRNHWRVRKQKDIYPKSILIKIYGDANGGETFFNAFLVTRRMFFSPLVG